MKEASLQAPLLIAPQFKPYPEYMDSGVEWLGRIPVNWNLRRLKHVISEPITDGPHETPDFLTDGVPFLSVDGIQEGELVFEGCRFISEPAHRVYSKKCAPRRDDILLGKAASTGKIARVKVDFEFSVWSPLALIRPDTRTVWPSFLEYALKASATQAQIDILCTESTQKNISMEDIPNLQVFLPSLREQRDIAAFLDRETARIDALVAKKERLIELLEEKRTALITRAVTKGLDPTVPMKDSGVEWLGEIPAHWEVPRLGMLATIGNGSTPAREDGRYWLDGSYPWLTSALINKEVISDAHEFVTDVALRECHLPRVLPGSVLVAITGEGQTRGRVAFLKIESTISQHLAYIAPNGSRLAAEFLARVLQARYQWLRFASSGAGSTRAALTCNFLKTVQIALPPISEQNAIAALIGGEVVRSGDLIAKVREAVDRLSDLRTAVISAAVTGRIDVRGLAEGGVA